jgi:hypothetical protein
MLGGEIRADRQLCVCRVGIPVVSLVGRPVCGRGSVADTAMVKCENRNPWSESVGLLQGLREREGDLVQGRREGDPVSDVYSANVKKRRSSRPILARLIEDPLTFTLGNPRSRDPRTRKEIRPLPPPGQSNMDPRRPRLSHLTFVRHH